MNVMSMLFNNRCHHFLLESYVYTYNFVYMANTKIDYLGKFLLSKTVYQLIYIYGITSNDLLT